MGLSGADSVGLYARLVHLAALTFTGYPNRVSLRRQPAGNSERQAVGVYEADIHWADGTEFEIVEIDPHGTETSHGPFKVGESYGSSFSTPQVDWAPILQARISNLRAGVSRRLAARKQAYGGLKQLAWWGWMFDWWFLVPRWDAEALLRVSKGGVTRVTFDELFKTGADFSRVFETHLALTDDGERVARHVVDADEDGVFGPGDSVEFVATITPTLYSDQNTYRLSVDRTQARKAKHLSGARKKGARPAVSYTALHTEHFEAQAAYNAFAQGTDPWYDLRLHAKPGEPALAERPFSLPGYAGGDVEVTVELWGMTNLPGDAPEHRTLLSVNGIATDNVLEFDGLDAARHTFTVPEETVEDSNTLRIEVPGDTGFQFDVQVLDKFSVTYQRRMAVHEGVWSGIVSSRRPVLVGGLTSDAVAWRGGEARLDISGATALPGRWRAAHWDIAEESAVLSPEIVPIVPEAATAVTTDYLIITHPLFLDHLGPVEALQHARGLSTHAVSVDDIYAAYSDHEPSADAIRAYISDSDSRFVLLVGGDTFDYLDHMDAGGKSFVPTHYTRTHPNLTFAPSDWVHADGDADGIPDVALGRIPVRSVEELERFTEKLYAYEPPTHLTFVAGESDAARKFSRASEKLADVLPSHWTLSETYADDMGVDPAKATLLSELNMGGSLVSYYGHSDRASWGSSRAGILFNVEDAAALTNEDPFIMVQWGCWNTYYVDPLRAALSDVLLFSEGGAVAVLGSTGLTGSYFLKDLGSEFIQGLNAAGTLGEALLDAIRNRATEGHYSLEPLRGYVLLGDPATPLR